MKVFRIILMVIGSLFSLILVAIIGIIVISPFFDNYEKKLKQAINSNNIEYVTKHIKKYRKVKIDYNKIITNKNYDLINVFIENDLVPDEIVCTCYKYDENVIDMFVRKYGKTDQMYQHIISSLGPDKLEYFLLSNSKYDLMTIFFDSSKKGNYQILKYLVEERKMDPNIEDEKKMTPLFYLVNSYDKHGESLFNDNKMYAFFYLIKEGADIYHKDINNRSVLSYSFNTNVAFLQYLIQKGLNVNEQDNNGNTILHYYFMNPGECYDYNLVIKDYLLSINANQNICNKEGKTPLDYYDL